MMVNYWAIIVAAGTGQRMRSEIPKQYLTLHGKMVLASAIQPFIDNKLIKKIVVVIAADDQHWHTLPISQHEKVITAIGGAERIDSCLKGLAALQEFAQAEDWILDHDAARPCLSATDLSNMLASLATHPVGGILAYPVVDTLKRTNDQFIITDTLDRKNVWHAATPQMFRYEILLKALNHVKQANVAITDNASALELLGYNLAIVAGSRNNIKITYPEDVALAEFYLTKDLSEGEIPPLKKGGRGDLKA